MDEETRDFEFQKTRLLVDMETLRLIGQKDVDAEGKIKKLGEDVDFHKNNYTKTLAEFKQKLLDKEKDYQVHYGKMKRAKKKYKLCKQNLIN